MTTLQNGLKGVFLWGLTAAFVILAAQAPQEDKAENKKAEPKKNGNTPAAAPVIADFKISVEGMPSVPLDTKVEIVGLDNCEVTTIARMNAEGQGKLRSVPPCVAELKITVTGLNTRIAQLDFAKYKGSPVKIEIVNSSRFPTVAYPEPPPPAVLPTK
jgi:hypothetical protein